MKDVFVARQPIFDRRRQVHGYEVLFRNSAENRALVNDADGATSTLLENAFFEFGLDRVVGNHAAFINVTRSYLTGERPLPPPSDRLILEILEDIEIDDELVRGVEALASQGYVLALDDVIYAENLRPLLKLVSIVKVELPRIPEREWEDQVKRFREYDAKILAEKVETEPQFELCRDAGYDYFQGYFFSRPQMMAGRALPANQITVLQLIGELNRPDVSIADLERILKSDAALGFKLLKFVNSARCGVPRRVSSLQQAIQFLGIRGVRTLAMMAATSCLACDRPETLRNVVLRAILCEKLSRIAGVGDSNACYTAGLISGLDAVLDVPLDEILAVLPVSDDILAAVKEHRGPVGEIVKCALSHERVEKDHAFQWNQLPAGTVSSAYVDALRDVEEVFQ